MLASPPKRNQTLFVLGFPTGSYLFGVAALYSVRSSVAFIHRAYLFLDIAFFSSYANRPCLRTIGLRN